ncbi:thioredoxin family protein [Flagellimonas sp. HMM57]|uniref:thioredoxin family protein n=1 Tax=unclassified Flagellimonas TaxID=2644544 RepID=UPI0013D79F6B|nr:MULTISPECIES: thioredoxin family protein [unclassified Flagellimonas]UII74561.1 thioredoxin family protein [Flagellimonas sp. HMM57]
MVVVEKNMKSDKKDLIQRNIANGMDYKTYRDLVHDLAQNERTTGENQSEALINYTQLNDRRMNRWDKTLKIPLEIETKIANLPNKFTFLVISESWCGDASPALPVINKVVERNANFELKIVLRDENLELMNEFLTNGSQSIPKLIIWNQEKEEIFGEWGPRSSVATKMVEAYKEEHGKLTPEFKQDLQVWYNKDKGQTILNDLVALLTLK